MSSVFDEPIDSNSSSSLPAGYHLVYHNPNLNQLGVDGYDNYQAPVDTSTKDELFRRRMWVRGKIEFLNPILFDTNVECLEQIKSVRHFNTVCFVNIERKFVQKNQTTPLVIEERTLAYSNSMYEKGISLNKALVAREIQFREKFRLSQTENFRYSSLTYNAHKIHYDIDYCKVKEGFPKVLISGPLSITVILNWFSRKFYPNLHVSSIVYKNTQPIYLDENIELICFEDIKDEKYSIWIINSVEELLVDASIRTVKSH